MFSVGFGSKAMREIFSFENSDYGGFPDDTSGFQNAVTVDISKQTHSHGRENLLESGDMNFLVSNLEYYQDNVATDGFVLCKYQQDQQLQSLSDLGSPDNFCFDIASPPFQSCKEEIQQLLNIPFETSDLNEVKGGSPFRLPSASFEILKNFGNRFRQVDGVKINLPHLDKRENEVSGRKLSGNEIIRLAGEKYIQSYSQGIDDISAISHPFASSFLGLSDEENKDVKLVQCLLASAEKVGQQQFERASKLLNQCEDLSSDKGNPIQRLVYYFSGALHERIDRETGRMTSKGLGKILTIDLEEELICGSPAILAFHQCAPLSQVSQFAGVQAIVETVADAKKVHIIDLHIKHGVHCIVLMQALAARYDVPIEHLKITAVATKSKQKIEETGERLMSFAQTMNLSFSFKLVMVADILDLSADLFELDAEEAVAVYSSCLLRSLISLPNQLDFLLRMIRSIRPRVMVVTEVEANHNSPVYVNRFIEALFSFGAFFDCLGDCMSHDEQNRLFCESNYLTLGIRNIVAAEGKERRVRHVNVNVWRAFFARFGLVEVELSMSSLYQTSLVLEKFACGGSCTLDMDGKCLIIGWKGTPLFSLSAWKFS